MFPLDLPLLLSKFASVVNRIKTDDAVDLESNKPQLARVLTILDLTALGVGSTLGVGSYVLSGEVAKYTAGPAVTVSFFVAAVVSILAALCYAEFAARVPKAGSAYVYSYMTVGEFCAFVIGWNLILEYVIGTASVAKALSGYMGSLTGKVFETYMLENYPLHVSFLGPYPDFIAFSVIMLVSILLAWGVKESSMLNNIFTSLNLVTVAIIIFAGATVVKPSNWFIPKEDIPQLNFNAGEGGFMPYGWSGVFIGAATCFFSFVGFDGIATCGEEAKNPQRSIPVAIVLSLFISFGVYFSISAVLTLMWPYYDQDPIAPFPTAFEKVGLPQIKWIVSIGAMFALCTSLLGSMFPMPRILYAMADDGLICEFLAKINEKTLTPLYATILSGILAGTISAVFSLAQLVDMMSIGTLLAYSIVSLCILLLRYRKYESYNDMKSGYHADAATKNKEPEKEIPGFVSRVLNLENECRATEFSEAVSKILIGCFCVLCFLHIGGLIVFERRVRMKMITSIWLKSYIIGLGILMAINIILLRRQPQANMEKLKFKVPLMPWVPILSIYMNTYLMSKLDKATWMRFGVWLLIGLIVYLWYGLSHSKQGKINNESMQMERRKNLSKR